MTWSPFSWKKDLRPLSIILARVHYKFRPVPKIINLRGNITVSVNNFSTLPYLLVARHKNIFSSSPITSLKVLTLIFLEPIPPVTNTKFVSRTSLVVVFVLSTWYHVMLDRGLETTWQGTGTREWSCIVIWSSHSIICGEAGNRKYSKDFWHRDFWPILNYLL